MENIKYKKGKFMLYVDGSGFLYKDYNPSNYPLFIHSKEEALSTTKKVAIELSSKLLKGSKKIHADCVYIIKDETLIKNK